MKAYHEEIKKRHAYVLSEEELRAVQLIEVEMIEEIDRICRKCHIRYCISAGTQLGAVRHQGFIPWDDDADIAFLRPEYEKFKKDFIFRIIEIRPDTGGDMENFAEKERNLYAYIRKICRMNREFS